MASGQSGHCHAREQRMRGPSLVPASIASLPWRLIFIVTAIATFGGFVQYSAGGGLRPWAFPHMVRFGAFLGMAILISYISPRRFRDAAFPAYGVVLILLILVEALGFMGGGAQRWLNLGFIVLQPSELMKPVIVLTIASFYELLP